MTGKIEKSASEDAKHDGDITCVAYQNGYVFTGGADGKIKVILDISVYKNLCQSVL